MRARQSIEPTSQKHQVTIEIEDRLSERILSTNNLSDWLAKLEETFNDRDVRYEGGETSREAAKRIVSVLEELLNGPGKTILIVTHGNLMSLLLNHFNPEFGFDQWKRLTNPDVYLLEFSNPLPLVKRLWAQD